MKKTLLFCFMITLVTLQSCFTDKCTDTREFFILDPVRVTPDEFRTTTIKTTDAQVLENPGKMNFYNQYLFINEQGRGVHVYDLTDENNPVEITFYAIDGNFDIAIKDNIMYADNVVDLLAIDISSIRDPKLLHRFENYQDDRERETYIAYYIKSNRTQVLDCTNPRFNDRFIQFDNFALADAAFEGNVFNSNLPSGTNTSSQNVSINGSFARFTIVSDYLYTVSNSSIHTFDISGSAPEKSNVKNLDWGIETIFPYQDKLFIGSSSGMFIFDNSDPATPTLAAKFDHARACDPVVVENDIAYVTLRDGNRCQGFTNQLDVLDVSNIYKPKLLKSYQMLNPHGLSVRDNIAYICEGKHGLKVFDVAESTDIKQIDFEKDMDSYDVISLSSTRLLLIGADGFFFINSTEKDDLKVVSSILIGE